MFSSAISLWILFPDADTAHDDVFVVVDADDDDDLPPLPPPDIIIIIRERIRKRIEKREMEKRTVLCPEKKGDTKKGGRSEATLIYQSQVSILGPVGYGPTTLPLRHSDLLII